MRRGVEAVFQLLIGVFTAILVVTVAYHVLGAVQLNRCHEKWQNSAVQLANALADAARSSGASNFIQLTGKCGGASYVEYTLIEHSKDPQICNRICHKPVSTCYDMRGNRAGSWVLLCRYLALHVLPDEQFHRPGPLQHGAGRWIFTRFDVPEHNGCAN